MSDQSLWKTARRLRTANSSLLAPFHTRSGRPVLRRSATTGPSPPPQPPISVSLMPEGPGLFRRTTTTTTIPSQVFEAGSRPWSRLGPDYSKPTSFLLSSVATNSFRHQETSADLSSGSGRGVLTAQWAPSMAFLGASLSRGSHLTCGLLDVDLFTVTVLWI